MRPLALLVTAESVAIVVLAVLCLGRGAFFPGVAAPTPEPVPGGAPAAVDAAPATGPDSRAAVEGAAGAVAPPADEGEAAEGPEAEAQIERTAAVALAPPVELDAVGIVVSGTVSAAGEPVAEANVYFRRGAEYRGGESAAPGTYAIAGLSPGEWTVTCRADGYAAYEQPCVLDGQAFQRVDVELQRPYVVLVRIQGADGSSILPELQRQTMFGLPYVVATAEPLRGDLPFTESSRLLRFGIGEWRGFFDLGRDADPKLREQGYAGELRLNAPPPAHAALLVRNALLQTQPIAAGETELVFTIEPADVNARYGTVALRLLNGTTGAPLSGVGIGIGTAQGGGSSGKTDDEGRAVVERVLPGLGCLQITRGTELESVWRYVVVPSGGRVDLGDVTLTAATKITGRVVDAGGNPVNGASVQWTELDNRAPLHPLVTRRHSRADADGRFGLWGCGRHRYVVTTRLRDGRQGHVLVDASGGEPPPCTLVVRPGTEITLRADIAPTAGYVVTALTDERTPVAVVTLGSDRYRSSVHLPAGAYTIEIHDMLSGALTRSFPLAVGGEPLTIDVP